ncbi:hypothetical protein HY642_03525 [Candidatus Woesearchaeota archaeon]|nr:hypothetical protein [Candidatus Woesearchaeota archaeon]
MVKQAGHKGKKVFVCERCDFKYRDEKWAKACEDWEKDHNSCNVQVIAHAIKQ